MPPGKKAQRKKAPEKIGKIASPPRPPQNIASRKNTPRKIAPRKIVLVYFCCFWHYLTVAPLKSFYSN